MEKDLLCLDKSKSFVTFDVLFMAYVKAFELGIFTLINSFATLAFTKAMLMQPLHSCYYFSIGLLILYVDDLLITGSNHALLQTIVSTLRTKFAMTSLGQTFNVILVSSFNEHITIFFCIKQTFVSPFFTKPKCWIFAQLMCLSMKELFSNVSSTLLLLILVHIDNLCVSFYISFACISTLPTLSMLLVDTCKHLKLPIFKLCFFSFVISIVTLHVESIT